MQRIEGTRSRVWIALAGLLLLAMLAIGFMQAGANASPPAGAAGYGGGVTTGNGKQPCRKSAGGYQTVPCPSNVSGVSVKPGTPVAGRGFKVTFKSKSGGVYTVVAKRNGKKSALESGATGTGKTTTKKVGQDLKAGKYKVVVTVNSGRGGSDSAKQLVRIKKK